MAVGMLDEDYLHTTTAGLIRLVMLYEDKSPYMAGHSRQVADLAFALGQSLDLSSVDLKILQTGALLHRVGILHKIPELITEDGCFDLVTFETLSDGPAISAGMLDPVPGIKPLTDIVKFHREWVDGTGSNSLKGDQIPLGARIVGLCEGFTVLVSNRPDRPSFKPKEAMEAVRQDSYKRYDAHLVTIFASVLGLS